MPGEFDVREKARELAGKLDSLAGSCVYRSPTIESALTAARNQGLEEAAKVADEYCVDAPAETYLGSHIRDLKTETPE